MAKIKDRVFGTNVDKEVIDVFNNLQRGSFKTEALEPSEPTHQDYLGDRTTFARMWTALTVTGSGDYERDTFFYVVNDNRDDNIDYEPNEPIGQTNVLNELSDGNVYLKPKAGIKSISVKSEGALGVLKNINVEFVVHNKKDFDTIFLPYFLRPGSTVVIDYGWSDKSFSLYDVEERVKDTDLELSQFRKFIYDGLETGPNGEEVSVNSDGSKYYYPEGSTEAAILDDNSKKKKPGFLKSNPGIVDTLIGIVKSYNAKVNQQGSFECSIDLITENATLLDMQVSEDNKLKFIFANKIEEILVELLSGDNTTIDADYSTFKDYSTFSQKDKREHLNNFFQVMQQEINILAEEEQKGIGVLPESSIQLGIYYEDVIGHSGINKNNKNILYICFGMLEDLFLNNFIAQNTDNKKFEVTFDSEEYFVRFDQNLFNRQQSLFYSNDELPLFLYPQNWKKSYNSIRRNGGENENYNNQVNGTNIYNTSVIPLRELFISVPLVSEAFSKKQNVNDAIDFIFEQINGDSYDVIKLKMISPNRSNTSISFQDVNLLPSIVDEKENLLEFDVTSDKSIVSNLDYSFETPKGGLQNMIAISNKTDDDIFDNILTDNLNFLNILKSEKYEGKDVKFISLPLNRKKSEDDAIDVDFDFSSEKTAHIKEFFQSVSQLKDIDGFTTSISPVQQAVKALAENQKILKDKLDKVPPPPKSQNQKQQNNVNPKDAKGKKVLSGDTRRDIFGKRAKVSTILSKENSSVSTILPINLTLSIYGNTYLNVGDVFTINFLPSNYSDNVYFQITNFEHKIDSNWQTTYNTVMRIRPKSKGQVVDTNYNVALSEAGTKRELEGHNDATKFIDGIPPDKSLEFVDVGSKRFDVLRVPQSHKDIETTTTKGEDLKLIVNDYKIARTSYDAIFLYVINFTLYEYLKEIEDKVRYVLHQGQNLNQGFKENFLDGADEMKDKDVYMKFHADGGGISTLAGSLFNLLYEGLTSEQSLTLKTYRKQTKATMKTFSTNNAFKYFKTQVEKDSTANFNIDDEYAIVSNTIYFKALAEEESNIYLIKPINFLGVSEDFASSIQIPSWLINDNVVEFCKTLAKNWSEYADVPLIPFAEIPPQNEIENPGYPFTTENYNKAPFGSSANAFEARQKLAQKFGFDGYGAYRGAKSLDDRKADWDNSSELY